MRRVVVAVWTVVLVLVACRDARGEPLRLRHDAVCQNDHGTLELAAGAVILSDPAEFDSLDARLRAAENAVTGLRAENATLRASASDGGPWWGAAVIIATAVAGGIGVGWYAARR